MSEHSGYPGAPPGWYPDPAGGTGERWWDGYAWSQATRTAEQAVTPPAGQDRGTGSGSGGSEGSEGASGQSGYPGAPPGWYPDPAGGPGLRWWDGYAWTDTTVLPERPPPPPWASAPPPQGPPSEAAPWAVAAERLDAYVTSRLVDDELRLAPAARWAVAVPAVYFIVNLIVLRVNAAQWRTLGHEFRVTWHDAQNHNTPPAYNAPSGGVPYSLSVAIGVLVVAAVIVACIWQHRAASAARALGYPSERSPAWGVGCWFVPIVNLWMPYRSIRDCLPPGDPQRTRVLRWWVALLAAGCLWLTADICALVSTGLALAVSIPAAVAAVALVAVSYGVVPAIAAAHRTVGGGLASA